VASCDQRCISFVKIYQRIYENNLQKKEVAAVYILMQGICGVEFKESFMGFN
jgi:hypothetical protein